jgi:MFS family permease
MFATLRQRNFLLLWLGGLISFAGDWVLIIALPVFVYDMTGSAFATGAMFMAQTLPRLLFSSLAGVFVDRWDRKRTLVFTNLAQAAVLPMLLLVQSPAQLWLLYLVAFAQTALGLFLQPAESALVPCLVGKERLLQANSLLAFNWELMRLVAPPLGGALMATLGLGSVVLIDSISFLAAGVLLALVSVPTAAKRESAAVVSSGDLAAVGRELAAGLRLAWRNRLIGALFLIVAASMVSEGIGNVLGFPWLKAVLNGGALERGWLSSAQAVGGLAGGLLIGPVSRRVKPLTLIVGSGLLLGAASLAFANIALFPIGREFLLPLALALKVVQGLPIIGFFVSLETLLQAAVPDQFRGRIFGAYSAACALATLAGQLLASLLAERIGIVVLFNGVGLMFAVAGLLALALLPRRMEMQSAPSRDAGTADWQIA